MSWVLQFLGGSTDKSELDMSNGHSNMHLAQPPPNPYAVETKAYKAKDGSVHPTREAALDRSRRLVYKEAYDKATKELNTVTLLGGPFDRYDVVHGRDAKDLVIHQILTHKDHVRRILDSIPKEPK